MHAQRPSWRAVQASGHLQLRFSRQIHRIVNELESGTDAILLEERIPRVSWLTETARPAPSLKSASVEPVELEVRELGPLRPWSLWNLGLKSQQDMFNHEV